MAREVAAVVMCHVLAEPGPSCCCARCSVRKLIWGVCVQPTACLCESHNCRGFIGGSQEAFSERCGCSHWS